MRILIIGNLNGEFATASIIACQKGAKVKSVSDINQALITLRNGHGADLILMEVNDDINQLYKSLDNERISVPIIACGFEPNSMAASQAIRNGANDYMQLPPNAELIAAVLEAISSNNKEFIYKSKAMANILDMVNKVAKSSASILITGESGTGKEIIANLIHKKSDRKEKNFISINCAAIPNDLLESELFGYEKGAFTGAISKRIGKFEEANNGTLFLDEITEMDIKLQAKLLRAIQEKEIVRLGGNEKIKLDVRIIATSNRNIIETIRKGEFREDLYFRLNVINLKLPALRERKEDIEILANYFIRKYAQLNNIPFKTITQAAINKLTNYSWPGNVRELENTIYRALLLSDNNQILDSDIELLDNYIESNFIGRSLSSVEEELIINTYKHCLGNEIDAAKMLGISIKSLQEKLEVYK